MSELIKVSMADYKTGISPDNLISYGLGSCVGIALYDPVARIGGLAHIMLPNSAQSRSSENPAKFADTAIPLVLNELARMGAQTSRLSAKIAGGAQMFSFMNSTDIMRVGERNVEAVHRVLQQLNVKLVAEDTGGNYGRTVELQLATGKFRVKTINKGEKDL
jgi:chemotaxis protein CheD